METGVLNDACRFPKSDFAQGPDQIHLSTVEQQKTTVRLNKSL